MNWDIYEITSKGESLQRVMFRGRIRRFGLVEGFNVLVENVAEDEKENAVRFAVLNKEDAERVKSFIKKIFPAASVSKVLGGVKNPVLSKLKVNKEERYNID